MDARRNNAQIPRQAGSIPGVGSVGPTGLLYYENQTAFQNATCLNRVLVGVDFNVFSYSAVLVSKFQFDTDIAV